MVRHRRAVTVGPLFRFGGFSGTTVASTELEWFGTLRGRLGITPWQTTLLYVTGGLAYGKINTSVSTAADFGGSQRPPRSRSAIRKPAGCSASASSTRWRRTGG